MASLSLMRVFIAVHVSDRVGVVKVIVGVVGCLLWGLNGWIFGCLF